MRAQRKSLKPSIGLVRRLTAAVVLLDDLVQVLGLADDDWFPELGVKGFESRRIRAPLIDRHFLW
jgi:hypothetical protein